MAATIPVEDRSTFEIKNESNDIKNYEFVKSFWEWDEDTRVKNFPTVILKICKLIGTSKDCPEIIKREEIRISTFEKLGKWIETEVDLVNRLVNHYFATEGIKKSPEFCFQMILRQVYGRLKARMLNITGLSFNGSASKWAMNEINQRLGMTDYKIYENLDEFIKQSETVDSDDEEDNRERRQENGTVNGGNGVFVKVEIDEIPIQGVIPAVS